MPARAPEAGVSEPASGQAERAATRAPTPAARPSAAAGGQMLVGAPASETAQRQKSLTIGAVCKALAQEFPDISISKIRYLEDQKLLAPRRTPGGYRLYTQGDVARLRTILRMQRDEFLPLRDRKSVV